MKRLTAAITAGLLLTAPAFQAQYLTTEALPVVYFNLPMGGASKATQPVYGLRLTQAGIDGQGGLSLFQTERPAMLDFQLKNGRINAFRVNGLNALTQTEVVYADGTSGTEISLSTGAIVTGVVVGGFILYKATEDDAPAPSGGTGVGDGGGADF